MQYVQAIQDEMELNGTHQLLVHDDNVHSLGKKYILLDKEKTLKLYCVSGKRLV